MPNLNFYANRDDCNQIFLFILNQPGWILSETYSQPGAPLRTIPSLEMVHNEFRIGEDFTMFNIYTAEMNGFVQTNRIELKPGAIPGKTFRFERTGWGLVHLHLGAMRGGALSPCHTNHNSELRARKWAPTYPEMGSVESWDWAAVTSCSRRLCNFVRRISVSKLGSRPVLAGADAGFTHRAMTPSPT